MNGTALPRSIAVAVRAFAALVVVLVGARIVAVAAAPSGVVTTSTDLSGAAAMLTLPKPTGRVEFVPRSGAVVAKSPFYVDLSPLAEFEEVTVRVRYRNPGKKKISLGALSSNVDGAYAMRAVEHPLLDALPWPTVSDGRTTLFQRHREFASVDDFFGSPPAPSRIAELGTKFHVAGDAAPPEFAPSNHIVSLRGSHRFFTAAGGTPLEIAFTVQDMNREAGEDALVVTVFDDADGTVAATTVLADDGNARGNQKSSPLRQATVRVPAPRAGVYRIEVAASDDVFIRELRTSQRKLVVGPRVFFGDYIGYSDDVRPAVAYAGGRRIAASAAHDESVQQLSIAGRPLELAAPLIPVSAPASTDGTPVPVVAPKRDVVLRSDGYFSFSQDSYFAPRPRSADAFDSPADLAAAGVEFAIADYVRPHQEDGVNVVEATFAVSSLARTPAGAYRFAVDVSGIGEAPGDVVVERVTFLLRRTPTAWRDIPAALRTLLGSTHADSLRVAEEGTVFGEVVE